MNKSIFYFKQNKTFLIHLKNLTALKKLYELIKDKYFINILKKYLI